MGVASCTLSAAVDLADVFFHSNKRSHQKMSTLTRDGQLCSFVFCVRAVLILSPSRSVVSPSLPPTDPILFFIISVSSKRFSVYLISSALQNILTKSMSISEAIERLTFLTLTVLHVKVLVFMLIF